MNKWVEKREVHNTKQRWYKLVDTVGKGIRPNDIWLDIGLVEHYLTNEGKGYRGRLWGNYVFNMEFKTKKEAMAYVEAIHALNAQ